MIVNNSDRPSKESITVLLQISGDYQYIGKAESWSKFPQSLPTPTPVAGSPTVINFAANHGLTSGNQIVISGMTGNWAPLNGTYIVTVTDADSVTVVLDSSGFGAVTGTMAIETHAPLTTKPVWAIQRITSVASEQVAVQWAGGSSGMSNIWANRATLAYN
jgi:hypothetical protein